MVGNWSGMVRQWSRMVRCRIMGCWGMNRLGVMVRVNIRVMWGNCMN